MQEIARSKLTTKEQLTVPAAIRRMLGIQAGDELVWKRNDDGEVIVTSARKYSLDDIRAIIAASGAPKPKRPLSKRQMNEAIAEHLRKKHGIR